MLVTVSGPPGSGKSTMASALAERFGLDHTSGGDIFRALAAERGHTLAEFNELAERDPDIDRDLDKRLYTIAQDSDDCVLESRLAGWLAAENATLRIWLDAPLNVRAARIADREDKPVEQAREETREREKSEAERYQEYYNIDIADRSIYDLVINTARWDESSTEALLAAGVENYSPERDEGAFPIEDVRYDF